MKIDKVTKWKTLLWSTIFVQLLFSGDCRGKVPSEGKANPEAPQPKSGEATGVRVNETGHQVVLDNGLVQVTFASPTGYVTGIRYGGLENILDTTNKINDRGYWDIVSTSNPDTDNSAGIDVEGKSFKIITETPEKAEISFLSPPTKQLPLQVDFRYVMLKGSSGFYVYAIFERQKGSPTLHMDQIRTVFKLQETFNYMAVSDKIQRIMPTIEDRDKGQPLAFKEAVLLTNPTNPELKGQVDDKYQYSLNDIDNKLHGWVNPDEGIGMWLITPTDEFRMGGPFKQDLTSHAGPIMIAMFHSTHYAGPDVIMRFKAGEEWKKVFGPYFVHLNSLPGKGDPKMLWQHAKDELAKETKSWPYEFAMSKDFPKANQRGSVSGRLLVNDGAKAVPANVGWVGLALPGDAGSWQYEMKGYQFWTQTDRDGKFVINNVHPGTYNLYATVPGFIGDFKSESTVNVEPGKDNALADQVFTTPRSGETLWEIGIPDRSAAEFFVPDPKPDLANPLFLNDTENKYRQYGLWDRYTDLYPKADLVYTIGTSDYKKDWFYAHVLRKVGQTYEPTTWQIVFPLKEVVPGGNYTLQIAIAGINQAELQVRVNNPDVKSPPVFTSTMIGRDNAVARHGIHGIYRLFSIGINSESLKVGQNTVFLTQSRGKEKFRGILYDYIRLEGPSTSPRKLQQEL